MRLRRPPLLMVASWLYAPQPVAMDRPRGHYFLATTNEPIKCHHSHLLASWRTLRTNTVYV